MAESFTPPTDVARNARRALDVRAEKPPSQRGMTPIGIARATQLANRQPVSLSTIRRMVAYFDRHEVDKAGSTWDEQGKGWQAWMGWGGDEGRTWANRILQENTKMENESKQINAIKKGGEWIMENPDMTFTVYVKDSQFLIYRDGARLLWTDNSGDAFDSINMSIDESYKKSIKASRRHSEADMKLIRQARMNIKATLDVLAELGDDGADDIAEAVDATEPTKRYAVKAEACAAMMTQLLAQTVHLYYKAHAAHWNVSSLDFPQYHEFFGEIYESMFAHIDPTAEFIRALGVKAPATLMELCAMMPADTMTEDSDLEDMLESIAMDNQAMLATIAQGIAITGIEGEFGVQNYLQDRMTQCQKLAWMLRESLAEPEVETPEAEAAEVEPMESEDEMMKALADRNATPKEREGMPAGDFVIPETRNFPVVTPDDIPAAVSSWGRYQGDVSFDEFKRRLIALAKRKGTEFVDALPEEWKAEMAKSLQNPLDTSHTMKVGAFAKRLLGRK